MNRFAANLCLLIGLILAGVSPCAGAEILTPKPDKEAFRRPDEKLTALKGERAKRTAELEEKTQAIDERIEARNRARLEALHANKPKVDWDVGFRVDGGLDLMFFSGFFQKDGVGLPGNRMDGSSDFGLPGAMMRFHAQVELRIRSRSGLFLESAWMGGTGSGTVGSLDQQFHGRVFPAGLRVRSTWEGLFGGGGLYYIFAPNPLARVRAELGTVYLRSLLLLSTTGAARFRVKETSDIFWPTLGFRGRFSLSDGVTFHPRITLGYLFFGDDAYEQENLFLSVRLSLLLALSASVDLSFTYRIQYIEATRIDHGLIESSRFLLHGPGVVLSVRIG